LLLNTKVPYLSIKEFTDCNSYYNTKQFGNKILSSWGSLRDLVCTALFVALGLVLGWLDLHVTEVIVTILALVAFGLLPSLIQPAAAWRWALLVAIGLPIVAVGAIKFGLRTAEPVQPDLRITLVALVFALLGAYIINKMDGDLISVIPNVRPTFQGMGATAKIDYILVIEKHKSF
jgi:hypothetical protein